MTSFLYYDSNSSTFIGTEQYWLAEPTVAGNVALTTSNADRFNGGFNVNFDGATEDSPPSISIFNTAQTFFLYFDETDNIVKWIAGGDPNINYRHKCSFVVSTSDTFRFFTLSIWTETNTNRFTWKRVGNTIVGNENDPPAKYMQIQNPDPIEVAGRNVVGQFYFIINNNEIIRNQSTMPFTSSIDRLDGAFLKCATTAAFGLGYGHYTGVFGSISTEADALVDISLVADTPGAWVQPDTVMPFYPLQLRRNRDVNNNLLNSFEIWAGQSFQRLCTGSSVQTGGRVVIMESSQANYGGWVPTNFNWGFEFNDTSKTISIFNQSLLDAGATDIWIGAGTPDGLEAWVRLQPYANRVQFPAQFLFIPIQYEFDRFNMYDDLKVQCCNNSVGDFPPANGYQNDMTPVSYSIYCPSSFVPESVTSVIKTNTTGQCDLLMEAWCVLDENKMTSICACLNPFDVPPLPDDSLINGLLYCFSNQCRTLGYKTSEMFNLNGELECPDELCANIINIEKGSNVEFEEAKQIIDCTDDDNGGGGPTDPGTGISTMTWIYIIVGSVVGLAIIIGISVGVSEANKAKEKEEAEKKKKAQLQRNLNLQRQRRLS